VFGDAASPTANTLGPRKVLQALQELAADHPQAKTLSGMRGSGARNAAGTGEYDLSRVR
jgi:hypothetical protein